MKRHRQLFEQIIAFENLLLAARKAQRGKRFTRDVSTFNHQLETELLQLQHALRMQTYRPGMGRHPTKQWVRPVTAGVDFLGYRMFPTHRRLLRASGYRFQRNLRGMQRAYQRGDVTVPMISQRIAAWIGHARHADTHGLRAALLGKAVFRLVTTRERGCCAAEA